MSKLNTNEFSAAIGIKVGTIKAHISRKKLERDEDGLIDTDTAKNKQYIKDQTKGKGLFSIETVTIEPGPDESVEKNSNQKKIVFNDKRTPEQKQRDKVFEDIELRKKTADLENAEYTAKLKKLEIEKKAGKLLPIELAQRIMVINIQTIFRTFEGESENVAGIFSEVLGGTRKDLSEIIKRMRESLSVAIKKAEDDSAEEIAQAIMEYTETRSRGERK